MIVLTWPDRGGEWRPTVAGAPRVRTIAVVSSRARREARRCTQACVVDGLDELAAILHAAGDGGRAVTRVDLIGHSTRGHHYLRLGRDALDLLDPRIVALVTALRTSGALDAAGARQLRLLGCATAVGPAAQAAMARLASLTGRAVSGTTTALLAAHYDAAGLRDEFSRLLVEVRPARAEATAPVRRGPHAPHLENAHGPHVPSAPAAVPVAP